MGQQIVELGRPLADQMGEDLALLVARQIGAGRRRREVELRGIARVLGHGGLALTDCELTGSR